MTKALRRAVVLARTYPTVVVSLLIILALISISIYAMITIPLSEAIAAWNDGSHGMWRDTPQVAPPTWSNLFRRVDLPQTITVYVDEFPSITEQLGESLWRQSTLLIFDYGALGFPSEAKFYYDLSIGTKRSLVTLTWIKPDGTEISLLRDALPRGEARLKIDPIEVFEDLQWAESRADAGEENEGEQRRALKGQYGLRIEATSVEEDVFSIDGKLLMYGAVYGVAGTDMTRRDLAIGLLWGTPIALMIGFIGAAGTTVFGFIAAAIGAWYGGWIDATIQRLCEVTMMIPFLPTILMIGWFYSTSIWVMLAIIVGFGLFSSSLKTYRAMFLHVSQSPYIEAAQAYGASNLRIIFRYTIPRLIPAALPPLVLGIPLVVYLEASLALLGFSDPHIPTWGKVLSEARHALYMGHYHWVFGPLIMLLLTGVSFSMLGYALDRILNPRLRNI
ncbi:ABC transporter permease [Candidatus Bipolaricaulota bacterium]